MEVSQPSLSRRRLDLDHVGNSTTTIPFDLIIEILSQLPGKSLIRFQSVSKLWFSTISSKYFVDLFLTRSKTRPRLLLPFMHSKSRKRFILSAPEHNNREDDKSSSTVIPRHDMTISDPVHYIISSPVNGMMIYFIRDSSIAVCNPTTRQIVKLPDVTPNGRNMYARLGYDPVEDQYKVLCVMTRSHPLGPVKLQQEHFVCTVTSSQKEEWRKVDDTTIDNYRIVGGGICINGAIYYVVGQSRIVRFDVRSEKMKLIQAPDETEFSIRFPPTLLNYKGKLGGVDFTDKKVMRLWTLEDAEKQEWSSMTFAFPSELTYLLGTYVVSIGEIHTGEYMVFHPRLASSQPFFVYYYDFSKESVRKVKIMVDTDFRRIHGIGELITGHMLSYPGYFENIRLL